MLIHHVWMQGFKFSPRSPSEIEDLQWGEDAKHMYWDETSLTALIQAHYSQWLPLFQKLPMTIMKCDVARAFILHYYGGCYADIDYVPSSTFANVIRELPLDRISLPRYFGLGSLVMPNNNFIFCAPKDKYWIERYLPYVKEYLRTGGNWIDNYSAIVYPPYYVFAFTGPLALWRTIPNVNITNENLTNSLGHNPGNVSNWIQYKRSNRHLIMGGIFTLVFLHCICSLGSSLCVRLHGGKLAH
jgi:mannosyltransferase OCH1-like enzyme